MPPESAGLVMYRCHGHTLEVLLAHPGGPFWKNKDAGAWSIPKGEIQPGEEPLAAALREFQEESGIVATGKFVPLTPVKLKSGKLIRAWAFEGDCDASICRSNTFCVEWPPRSGNLQEFPEVDRFEFFPIELAVERISAGQAPLLRELALKLAA